jgi:thiol-disulfide isomerase/thioredoxin
MLKGLGAVLGAFALALPPPGSPLSPEDIRPVDAPAVKRLLAENQGKVVALNFWATWCAPCVVEFPDLVALEKDFRSRGLAVISVSANSPDEISSELIPFLEKHQPGFRVYLWQPKDNEAEVREIDAEWTGSLPATFFIDRGGKTAAKRFSLMSREEMVETVEVLLGSVSK